MFHLVTLAWIFFRADSFGDALIYLTRLFTAGGWSVQIKLLAVLALSVLVTCVIQLIEYRRQDEWVFRSVPPVLRGLAYAGAVLYCILLGGSGGKIPFIYFQF